MVAAGGPWRVGVRHPNTPTSCARSSTLTDGAVATSARYERGDHILDGRTGRPATGLLSLTVVAPTLTEADSVATAAFAMGAEGVDWAAALDGLRGVRGGRGAPGAADAGLPGRPLTGHVTRAGRRLFTGGPPSACPRAGQPRRYRPL